MSSEHPSMPKGWGNGLIPTMNQTGCMFERIDRYAEDFIALAGSCQGRVLEVGCAYGVATLTALEQGANIVACDLSLEHLQVLGDRAKPEHHERLNRVVGRLPEMDFAPASFEAILCSRVLHFLEGDDVDAAVRRMAGWLVPGGRMFLVADTPYGIWRKKIPEFEAGKARGDRWPGMMVGLGKYLANGPTDRDIGGPPLMNLLDPEILERTVTGAGLDVVRCTYISRPDFGKSGVMDGRENAGVEAIRPVNGD